jgi:hypothetical protein
MRRNAMAKIRLEDILDSLRLRDHPDRSPRREVVTGFLEMLLFFPS